MELTNNPFHLLSVSMRSGRSAVEAAYEEALADGISDEHTLLRAHQTLAAPRKRLDAEVRWLPGVSPARARAIFGRLHDGGGSDEGWNLLAEVDGLARANLAAHLCAKRGSIDAALDALVSAQGDFDEGSVYELINGERQVAGIPPSPPELVAEALRRLSRDHLEAAQTVVEAAPHPGKLMTILVERHYRQNARVARFLDELGKRYERWSLPTLQRIRGEIAQMEERLRHEPSDGSAAGIIVQKLAEWDEYSQPNQLIDQAKELDEQHSVALYEDLRNLCLWLANEESQYQNALAISKALLETFPELPTVVVQSSEDLEVLEGLVEQTRQAAIFDPLLEALELSRKHVIALIDALRIGGFGPDALGGAGVLYEAFQHAARRGADTEHAAVPWFLVRDLAVEIHNQRHAPRAAFAIIAGMLAAQGIAIPPEVKQKLYEDLRAIQGNEAGMKVNAGAKRRDDGAALRRVEGAATRANTSRERQKPLRVQAGGEHQTSTGRGKWLFWTAVFVGLGIWFINESDTPGRRSAATGVPRSSYSAPPSARPTGTTASATARTRTATRFGKTESLPPVGRNNRLSTDQVRYCVYQKERLDLLEMRADRNSEEEIDRYNGLVNDYNSRCGRFSYSRGTLQSVKRELPTVRGRLVQEADALLTSWRRTRTSTHGPSVPARPERERDLVSSGRLFRLDNREQARRVQQRLLDLGFYAARVDGLWGPRSRAALKAFKFAVGLSANDTWDVSTQQRLFYSRQVAEE